MADDLLKDVGNSVKKAIDGHESVVGGAVLGAAAGMLLPGGLVLWGVAGGVAGALKDAKEKGKTKDD
ncbi:hypothetical protein [Enemella sp. A6]|uniref:hypothetical protein n=1 Tax=Enemella sp. A6 TaxID=3440152 RepID=UPI003EBA291A